jgi:hypothetical protein
MNAEYSTVLFQSPFSVEGVRDIDGNKVSRDQLVGTDCVAIVKQ